MNQQSDPHALAGEDIGEQRMTDQASSLLPMQVLAYRFLWWSLGLVALPLALFAWWVYLQAPSRLAQLAPVPLVEVWHEDLGGLPFTHDGLTRLVPTAPDWAQARWTSVPLPYFRELGAAIDLPPDAPKRRVWVKIPIPEQADAMGRQGILGFRVQGGPWSAWVDGQMVQANLSDWRIQWNVPLRVTVPMGAREVLIAVPYAEPQGFSVGSVFVGRMDVVDTAWQQRNLLHLDIPRFMSGVALMLMLVCLHWAVARPQEPMFAIFGFNALIWSISSLQFAFDVTGNDALALWFASAVDSSITWLVVLGCLFALEFERIRVPRLQMLMLGYAVVSTVMTLPVWNWQKNALMAQQYLNILLFLVCITVIVWRVVRRPRIEGWAMIFALCSQVVLGLHTLENLTNQTNPDSFYSFPLGTLVLYMTFTYVMGRRAMKALSTAERHEQILRERLAAQEQHLEQQHALLQKLEVQRHLTTQHQRIMQDLHDHLGSNLTSALLQARAGSITSQETVDILQDLADELRHIGKTTVQGERSLSAILAELRERVQHRLSRGGIVLDWAVDPDLPTFSSPAIAQHLRALLSEAIANAIKHARASRIRVEAGTQGAQVVIAVIDNGVGFDTAAVETGRGLPGMRNRAAAMGASWQYSAAEGGGTCWTLKLPLAVGEHTASQR